MKQSTIRKSISVLLSLLMLLFVCGGTPFSANAAQVLASGKCGDDVTWTLTSSTALPERPAR